MLKGVVIFGTGVTVGYALAMRNQDPNAEIKNATVEFVNSLKAIANDAWLDAKNKAKSEGEDVVDDAAEKVKDVADDVKDVADDVNPNKP